MASEQKSGSRSRNAAATREAILDSARRMFARDSYESVGLRDIAGSVGVDPALVNRYFGSKEALFKSAMKHDDEDIFAGVEKDNLPNFLAALLLDEMPPEKREAKIERLLLVLRSASSPTASRIVREGLRRDMLDPMAAIIGGEGADMRASLAMAVLMGTAILRSVMAVEPLHECTGRPAEAQLAALFAAAVAPSTPSNCGAPPATSPQD